MKLKNSEESNRLDNLINTQDNLDELPSELSILYQDEDIVAVNKPANIFVHRTYLNRAEKIVMLQWLRDQIDQYVYPVHRLDRGTSGVLLFALNETAARELCQSFESHKMVKTYHAITRGFAPEFGVIEKPLKEQLDKIADKFANQDKEAQSALTQFETLAQTSLPYRVGKFPSVRYSLVKLQPKTGRRHQLRRHLSSIAHPIIGDVRYGDNKQNQFFKEFMNFSRLMLHASQLKFIHPISHQSMTINAELDARWLRVLECFNDDERVSQFKQMQF